MLMLLHLLLPVPGDLLGKAGGGAQPFPREHPGGLGGDYGDRESVL